MLCVSSTIPSVKEAIREWFVKGAEVAAGNAIMFSTLDKEIPLIGLELFFCGAPIQSAPWSCPGTLQADVVTVDIVSQRPGLKICILKNHGLVATGKELTKLFMLNLG